MNAWVKALRAELGEKKGRGKAISQSELAELVGVGLSAVGKWEMQKDPQQPERDAYLKLFALASADLRGRAPQAIDLPEMSDPRSMLASNKDLEAFIARNNDDITDREKRFLRGLRYKGTPTDETWTALLEAFRAGRSTREG